MNPSAFSTLLFGLMASVAWAQTSPVYRCGNTYSQSPCVEGRAIDVDDSRTAAQRAEGARVSDDAKQSALRMERERLAEEARTKPAGAARLSPAPDTSVASAARHVRKPKKASHRRVALA